jgi:hypothetical protein
MAPAAAVRHGSTEWRHDEADMHRRGERSGARAHRPAYFKSSGGGMSGSWISMLTLLGSTPVFFSIQ